MQCGNMMRMKAGDLSCLQSWKQKWINSLPQILKGEWKENLSACLKSFLCFILDQSVFKVFPTLNSSTSWEKGKHQNVHVISIPGPGLTNNAQMITSTNFFFFISWLMWTQLTKPNPVVKASRCIICSLDINKFFYVYHYLSLSRSLHLFHKDILPAHSYVDHVHWLATLLGTSV